MMRNKELEPCDCEYCYFCENWLTNGIHPNKAKIVIRSPGSSRKRSRKIQCNYDRMKLYRLSSGMYCRQCRGQNKPVMNQYVKIVGKADMTVGSIRE